MITISAIFIVIPIDVRFRASNCGEQNPFVTKKTPDIWIKFEAKFPKLFIIKNIYTFFFNFTNEN